MIWVDELRACGAPWRGGIACRMTSDEGVDELLSFASALGLRRTWLEGGAGAEHFLLSPRLRAKALLWDAHACTERDMAAHARRRVAAERARAAAAVAELEECARARRRHVTDGR